MFCVLAVQGAAQAADASGFADEERDWKLAPTREYRKADYHAPTPREVPGARTVRTAELRKMMEASTKPWLIDVLGGGLHPTLAGAFWLIGSGAGDFDAAEQKRFVAALGKFAAGDKNAPFVFFCSSVQCWLSYNAALRAVNAGYTNVMWYRGGIDSWRAAGFPTRTSDPFAW